MDKNIKTLVCRGFITQEEKSIPRNLLKKYWENGENTGKVDEFY